MAIEDAFQPERPTALVRVVVLNYNRPQLTICCVSSVLKQEGVRMELVVVDNWSNEDQLEQMRRGLPSGVMLLENRSNLGYAAGNNRGLRLKSCNVEFALVLNNDTVMGEPNTLARLVSVLRKNKTLAACSPLVRDAACRNRPEESIQVRRIPNSWELTIVSSGVLRRLPGLRRIYQRQVYADKRPFELNSVIACETVNGCCFLIRESALEAIGFLDEGTFLYCEELILGFQLRSFGFGCALVTQSFVEHEQGASAGRNAAGATVKGMLRRIRSEIYFAKKYLRASKLAVILIVVVGGLDVLCKVAYRVFGRSK